MSHLVVRITSTVVSMMLVAALAACHTGTRSSSDSTVTSEKFPGPWGPQMQEMIDDFSSEFASQAFADGIVSEQELTEAKKIDQECYSAAGLNASWDIYGRVTIGGANMTSNEPPSAKCSFADGGVMVMYYQMLLNPRNEDEVVLLAAALTPLREHFSTALFERLTGIW